MRLATWNIWWFGHDERPRDPVHLDAVVAVLQAVDADIWVFQEICDHALLESVLARAGGRWTTRAPDGAVVDSGNPGQRVVIAWDPTKVQAGAWRRIGPGHRRPAVAVSLDGVFGQALWVVGCHLKAGWPVFHDLADAADRRDQLALVCEEVRSLGSRVVVAGDMNALRDPRTAEDDVVVASLHPLRDAGLVWPEAVADPAGGGTFSVWTDQLLLDHVLMSPTVSVRSGPQIVAFDLWPGFADEHVSDHRPVFVDLDRS